jgi:hypothetical protein
MPLAKDIVSKKVSQRGMAAPVSSSMTMQIKPIRKVRKGAESRSVISDLPCLHALE